MKTFRQFLLEAKNENFEGLSFDELYKELGIKKDKFKIVKYELANLYGIKILDKDNNECINIEVRDKYKVYYNDHNKERMKEFKNFDDVLKFVKSISKTILVESKQLNEKVLTPDEIRDFIDNHYIRKGQGTGMFKYKSIDNGVVEFKQGSELILSDIDSIPFKITKCNNIKIVDSNIKNLDNLPDKIQWLKIINCNIKDLKSIKSKVGYLGINKCPITSLKGIECLDIKSKPTIRLENCLNIKNIDDLPKIKPDTCRLSTKNCNITEQDAKEAIDKGWKVDLESNF